MLKRLLYRGLLPATALAALFIVLVAMADISAPPNSKRSAWHAYLTAEELAHPLAKYWYSRAPVAVDVLAAINSGPIEESAVLAWEDRGELIDADHRYAENGWRTMDDGSGYVAVRTFFPGATPEMIDWWFEWAQAEEDIRYKIWYPGAHYAMAEAPTPGAPDYKNPKPYWGKSRFPVEDVGIGVAQLRLDFVSPGDFGFAQLPDNATMLAVRVGLANGLLKTTDMIHYVRPVQGGLEMLSRFWIGREFEAMPGGFGLLAPLANTRFIKRRLVPENLPKELALHCANEYSQLASFLPELYRDYGPGAQ